MPVVAVADRAGKVVYLLYKETHKMGVLVVHMAVADRADRVMVD
jgi:hypothetical protein